MSSNTPEDIRSGHSLQATGRLPVGRFAPSPSGRMHLGNMLTALRSWISVKSRGGRWILRIEDLDPQRSRKEYARLIEDDLIWLGLKWDEGGLDNIGNYGPYSQSLRSQFYQEAILTLNDKGLLYPCSCKRADILATQAPHQSDGRIVYAGTCRPATARTLDASELQNRTLRLRVDNRDIDFTDIICGPQRVNLTRHCGDFVVRRADGAWAYQLAVVVDDALMGVNEVLRGDDLLLSSAQQIYLAELLGYTPPVYAHIPLVRNADGKRLSKRDKDMDMESIRLRMSPEQLLGVLAKLAGWQTDDKPVTLDELINIVRDNHEKEG